MNTKTNMKIGNMMFYLANPALMCGTNMAIYVLNAGKRYFPECVIECHSGRKPRDIICEVIEQYTQLNLL